MKSRTYWTISFSSLLILAAAAIIINYTPLKEKILYQRPGFSGSNSCIECHQEIYRAWNVSAHFKSADSVDGTFFSGRFPDESHSLGSAKIKPEYQGKKPGFQFDGEYDGGFYEVRMAIGYFPFQQYVVDAGLGRLQVVPIAWDNRSDQSGGQRWYYPDSSINLDEYSRRHWKATPGNWNSRCASCHSTGIIKGFNAEDLSYKTTYSEINVGCEGCHGPGSEHIGWALVEDREDNPPGPDDLMGFLFKIRSSRHLWEINPATGNAYHNKNPETETGINLCARCHSLRKDLVASENYSYSYWEDFLPALLTREHYYPDGGIKGQAYSWASFLQSKMHSAGVTCIDCHDAHTGKLFSEGKELCQKCHDQAKYDSRDHHFHDPDLEGGSCTSCHMPTLEFFGTDNRADHYIRVPRPDLTLGTGSPNACGTCHSDQDAEWAVMALFRWYGKTFFTGREEAEAFHAAWEKREDARFLLAGIIRDSTLNPITRASALAAYPYRFSSELEDLIISARDESSPLLRYAAALACSKLPPERTYETAFPLISDKHTAIRYEALKSASRISIEDLPRQVRMGHSNAMAEYINLVVANGDLPERMVRLADYYASLEDYGKAIALYKKALLIDPVNTNIISKLSSVYKILGMEQEYQELNRLLSDIFSKS